MTGFGQTSADDGQSQIYIEVKSLNSKFMDLNLRLPKIFSDKELEIRNLVSEKLERGKVSLSIEYEKRSDGAIKQTYNDTLFLAYYSELKKLADRVYAPYESLFELALNSPDVIQGNIREEAGDEVWEKVKSLLLEALNKCENFRVDEGKVLDKMLGNCCSVIEKSLEIVKGFHASANALKTMLFHFLAKKVLIPTDLSRKLFFMWRSWILMRRRSG